MLSCPAQAGHPVITDAYAWLRRFNNKFGDYWIVRFRER